MKRNYTYMVKCSDGTLYTGWTTNLEHRVKAHNDGEGAKYTRSRRPVELVYYEEYATKAEAMKREYSIKQLTRKQKEKLIENKNMCTIRYMKESSYNTFNKTTGKDGCNPSDSGNIISYEIVV